MARLPPPRPGGPRRSTLRAVVTPFLLATAPLLALMACDDAGQAGTGAAAAGQPDAATPTPGGAVPSSHPDTAGRPRLRTDTILIEGSPETVSLGLFRTPAGFPMPFNTYVPADMVAQWSGQGEQGVRFMANFGGVANRQAYVGFVAREASAQAAEMLARAYEGAGGKRLGGEMVPMTDLDERYPWARAGWDIHYDIDHVSYDAVLLLARHGNRLVQIVLHAPAEYGDGFWPRASLVLEHLRWADGAPLGN